MPPIPVPESPDEFAQRIEDELATIPDLPAPPGPVDPVALSDATTRKKMTWATLLSQAPPPGIKPSQLESGSGMGHTWTQQQLALLVEMGVITKPSTGRYLPLPGQDVWAGLERIRRRNDILADQARQMVKV